MTYLRRTTDKNEIEKILLEPEIWSRISEYEQDPNKLDVPIDDEIYWLGVYADDEEMVGLFFLHPESSYTATVHINILEQHRKKHAWNAARLFLTFVIEETVFEKIHAEVPVINPDVVRFTVKCGFTVEGLSRESIYKNAQMTDQFNLGITRAEIEDWLEQHKEV